MASAILDWKVWLHRKVETIQLGEDERARRRVSLDCTPQRINWPSSGWGPWRRTKSPQIAVPLTIMAKEVIRDFDVTDEDGRSIPILGKEENVVIAAAVMSSLIDQSGSGKVPRDVWDQLLLIAGSPEDKAFALAKDIVSRLGLNEVVSTFLFDFSANFLVVALLPSEQALSRQVVKYSYHWESSDDSMRMIWPGLGYRTYKAVVELGFAHHATSYHLEVPAPRGLQVSRIDLPLSSGDQHDQTPSVVGHAQASFATISDDQQDAFVHLSLHRGGLLSWMVVASFITTAFFSSLVWSETAFYQLMENDDSATALLLLGPALILGLSARGEEHAIVRGMLAPLRYYAAVLSFAYLAMGYLLATGASDATAALYATAVSWVSAIMTVVLSFGWLVNRDVTGGYPSIDQEGA